MSATLTAHFGHGSEPRISLSVPCKDAPMWWHTHGRTWTASGYGRRIPSPRMVQINGRWRRVYVCIFSNSGTAYVEDRSAGRNAAGRWPWIVITD